MRKNFTAGLVVHGQSERNPCSVVFYHKVYWQLFYLLKCPKGPWFLLLCSYGPPYLCVVPTQPHVTWHVMSMCKDSTYRKQSEWVFTWLHNWILKGLHQPFSSDLNSNRSGRFIWSICSDESFSFWLSLKSDDNRIISVHVNVANVLTMHRNGISCGKEFPRSLRNMIW